jgi:hypothetical protein
VAGYDDNFQKLATLFGAISNIGDTDHVALIDTSSANRHKNSNVLHRWGDGEGKMQLRIGRFVDGSTVCPPWKGAEELRQIVFVND